MGSDTSFSLDECSIAFIDQAIASGRYRSGSDVIRSALRLLEERETHLQTLRQALEVGEQSGPSTPFVFDNFLKRKRTLTQPDA
ncbi:type II toxin-antitoxin system ParD family antitoxin [Mycobacterium sp. SMC-18]|uniref:type II toxin-antitoxin system ParD family antitoxin n=1 Tax=Mycobacterium sp. SMC-18 TaxID=3381629 RepID=UPI00387758A1